MGRTTKDQKDAKISAISRRLVEMQGAETIMLRMLDEAKLDMIILALGIGRVKIGHDED